MSQDFSTSTPKNKHVVDYLSYYVSFPRSPYFAVLINGPWGIGKTFLVKRFLKDHFGDEKKYVYVSLFGLKDADEIDAALFQAL